MHVFLIFYCGSWAAGLARGQGLGMLQGSEGLRAGSTLTFLLQYGEVSLDLLGRPDYFSMLQAGCSKQGGEAQRLGLSTGRRVFASVSSTTDSLRDADSQRDWTRGHISSRSKRSASNTHRGRWQAAGARQKVSALGRAAAHAIRFLTLKAKKTPPDI